VSPAGIVPISFKSVKVGTRELFQLYIVFEHLRQLA
jgi:hypothetical protein